MAVHGVKSRGEFVPNRDDVETRSQLRDARRRMSTPQMVREQVLVACILLIEENAC